MRIFEDYEADARAKRIIEGIEAISATIGLMMGVETDIDEEITSELSNLIREQPLILAQDLMEINEKSLYKIQNVVGFTDEVYKQLSDSTAICILGILNFPLQEARLTLKNPVVENSDRGRKLRMWLHGSFKILDYLKKHYELTNQVRLPVDDSIKLINDIKYK